MARKYRQAVRKSPADDPQQFLVYRLENEAIGSRHYAKLTNKAIRQLARSVCRMYGIPQVKITFGELGRWAAEWSEPGTIKFNRSKPMARDLITVTHELAHHLHHYAADGGEGQEAHGPQFMACHMSILDTVRAIPVAAMRVVCKKYGVRYADPGDKNSLSALRRAVRS